MNFNFETKRVKRPGTLTEFEDQYKKKRQYYIFVLVTLLIQYNVCNMSTHKIILRNMLLIKP